MLYAMQAGTIFNFFENRISYAIHQLYKMKNEEQEGK